MNILINSKLCTKALLRVGWSARWVLEVHFDGFPPSGKVTVQWGKTKLVGTVVPTNTGQSVGAGVATIVGGIGWENITPSTWLVDTMAAPSKVAAQLAQAVGETITIVADSMREGRSAYARAMQPASMTLEDLLDPNALWWVGLDGTTFTALDRPSTICNAEVLHVEPHTRRVKLAAEEPSQVQPGMILKARDERLSTDMRIREVFFEADEHGVWAWAECDGAGPRARLPELLGAIVSEQTAHMHFRGATIQAQDRFGKVSLRLEERDRELADPLPMNPWYGVPGVSADLYLGTRTMLAFDRADPSNPFAAFFSPLGQTGHVPETVRHEAAVAIKLVGDSAGIVAIGSTPRVPVALAPNLVTYLQALEAWALSVDLAIAPAVLLLTAPQQLAYGTAVTVRTTAAGNISTIAATKLEAK